MFGRTLLNQNSVFPTRVSADGSPIYKPGGITIDWSTVTAAGSDVTLPDGSVIRSGQKYLRYGQVLTKKTPAELDTVVISGSPTGGTFTITVGGVTTPAIPYNASTAYVQGVVQSLSTVGNGLVLVTGSPGSYTLAFAGVLGSLAVSSSGAGLTGGSSPAATTTEVSAGTSNAGYFGPYDSSASDGRQTLTRGAVYILDETVLQYGSGTSQLSPSNDHYGSAVEGGLVWIDRVLHAGTGTASLAAGPQLAGLLAALPRLSIAQD